MDTLKTQIAKDVNEIKNDNKKHFGTKLPSNENKEQEQTLQELTYSQMIMGSMGALVWGQTNVLQDEKIKSLLGKKDNIFSLVESIKNNIENVSSINQLIEYVKSTKEILQIINTNIENVIDENTELLIKNNNELFDRLVNKFNSEKFNELSKSIDDIIIKLSKKLSDNFNLFINNVFDPKLNEVINSIKDTTKTQKSLKDSTTKILIDLKAADTIEQLLKDFDALDGIIIFDNDNVNKIQELLSKLDELSKQDIYLVINTNLYDTINELKKIKIDIYDPQCIDKIKLEIESLKQEKINLFDVNNINDIKVLIDDIVKKQINIFDINNLKDAEKIFNNISNIKFDENTKNILTEISSFLDIIAKQKFDVEKNKQAIKELTDFFGGSGQKTSIENLLNAVGNLNPNDELKQKHEVLLNAFKIIGEASKLMEGHDTKINKRFFKDLNIILTGEDYIKGLIVNLNDLGTIIIKDTIRKNIQIINDFITAVSNLGSLSLIKLIKSKTATIAINKFLVKDIKSLIEKVIEFKTTDKDTDKAFEALNNLFESIVKLGDITISDKRKMAKNIIFIDKFLAKDIRQIIQKAIPKLKDGQEEGFKVLEKTKEILDTLIGIADIDKNKFKLASYNIGLIEDFIETDVKELFRYIIEDLGNEDKLKTIINVTKLTQEIFENIEDINESIPTAMSLLKTNIKMMLLTIEFAFIEDSFKTLGNLSKLLTTKDKKFLSSNFDGTLDSIIEINGILASINTKQGIKDIIALDVELAYMYWCMDYLKEIAQSYTKVLKFNEFKKTIQNIKSAIDSIEITKEDYKKLSALTALLNVMYTLGQYASDKTTFDIEKFDEATEAILTGAIPFISEFVKDSDLDKILKDLITVNDKTLEKFDQIIKLIEKFDKLSKIAVLSKLSNIGLKGIAQEAEYIKVIIGKFSDINDKDIKKAEKSLKLFQKLVVMSAAILILGALVMKFIDIKNLLLFTGTLTVFLFAITGVFKLVAKSLKSSMEGAKGAILLIGASALILLLGSMAMNYVDFGNILLFTVSLGIFLFTITGIFRLFSKGLKKSLDAAQDAIMIVGASALIMLLGSKLIRPEDFIAAIMFAVELGIFLAAIGLAFKTWKGFDSKSIMSSAEDLILIIAISAASLIIGGIVTHLVGWGDLLLFTLELALIIGGTIAIYALASNFIQGAMINARDIAILIGVSGLVLILAGVLANQIRIGWLFLFELELALLIGGVLALYAFISMLPVTQYIKLGWELSLLVAASGLILILAGLLVKYIDIGSLALFTLILAGFVGAILLVYSISSKFFKKAIKGAEEMILLVAASALILIFGTIAVQKWIDIGSLALFALILAGFIFAITFSYSLFGKKIEKSLIPAIALAILTALSGLILIMGGKYLLDNPGLDTAVLNFGMLVIGYVTIMGLASALLGKLMSSIIKGVIAMGFILGITYLSILVIEKIRDVASKESFLMNILKGVGAIALIITAIGGIAFAAGALVMGPQALLFAAGAAAMATISGVAILAAEAVKSIAIAMMHMKKVEKFDASIMIDNIKGFISIAKEMEPIAKSFKIIMKASMAISMMSSALSSMAKTMKDWTELKIPVYDGTEIVGYEIITGDMFPKAAENIKSVVTTLGQAIIDIYEANHDMFDGPLFGLLDTPFIKVTKGIKAMGPALSSVAEAVKDWSDLRIPVYDGTKKIGYKTIVSDDFKTAAENIKAVVTTLGQAIIDVYYEAEKKPETKGMFDGPLFGLMDTPFIKVTKGIKTMGPALSSIADAVKDWADLKIPVYTGDKITGYKTIVSDDFKTAAENIKAVIKTLGEAIIETYDECEKNPNTKGMFDPQGFLGLGKSKFALVTKAFKTMGPMLSSIADGISKWADLKIPVYKGTEIVEYKTIKDKEFDDAAKNIKTVLKCIGEALVEVVEKNPKIFGEDIFTDGPAIVAAKAMHLMGETLNLTATSVASYASGAFPLFDKDGNYIKDIIVKEGDYAKAGENIQKVLTCIGNALADVVENSDVFDEGLFSDAPAIKAAEAIKGMSEALNNSVTAISKLAELNMDDLHAALDPNCPSKDNVYHRLNDLLAFTVDIYKLFVSENSDLAVEGKVSHWWRSDTVEKLSFAEYLNEHNGDVEDANKALGTFTDMLADIIEKFSSIGSSFNENLKDLLILSLVYICVNSSMKSFVNIIELLSNDKVKKMYENINDNKKLINDGIENGSLLINSLLNKIKTIQDSYNKVKEFNLSNVIKSINDFNECVSTLKNINNLDNKKINILLPTLDSSMLSAQISMYASAIKMIISVGEYAQEVGDEGYNILKDGILKIYAATNSIVSNDVFKQHVKDLKKYIESINSIKLNNLTHLKGLVDAMNQLSSRLGNLDKLTDAVANKLSAVLFELVNQLKKADASINNAHMLQEKRKKLIEDSVKQIENIMSQHMIVEISQKTDDENMTPEGVPDGSINGKEVNSNDNTTADTNQESADGYSKLDSPENSKASQTPGSSKPSDQALTKDEFMNYMQNVYLNMIRNKIKGEYM